MAQRLTLPNGHFECGAFCIDPPQYHPTDALGRPQNALGIYKRRHRPHSGNMFQIRHHLLIIRDPLIVAHHHHMGFDSQDSGFEFGLESRHDGYYHHQYHHPQGHTKCGQDGNHRHQSALVFDPQIPPGNKPFKRHTVACLSLILRL